LFSIIIYFNNLTLNYLTSKIHNKLLNLSLSPSPKERDFKASKPHPKSLSQGKGLKASKPHPKSLFPRRGTLKKPRLDKTY
jgi:hypothetical protein